MAIKNRNGPVQQQLNLDRYISETKQGNVLQRCGPPPNAQISGSSQLVGFSYFICSYNTANLNKQHKDFRMQVQKRIRFIGSPAETCNSTYTF